MDNNIEDNEQYRQYFNQLIDLDKSDLEDMVNHIEIPLSHGIVVGAPRGMVGAGAPASPIAQIFSLFRRKPKPDQNMTPAQALEEKCGGIMADKEKEIKAIVNSHTMSGRAWADCCYDIVQLVAPVVAQMMFGIPGLAIVGGILIVCKKRYAHFFAEAQPALTMESRVERIEK